MCADLERQGWFLSYQQARYDACRGHKITPFFSSRPLSALAWPRHSFQSTSFSSSPEFSLPVIDSPPCCLPPLLRRPTRLRRWGWRVSAAISRLSGKPRRLLQRYPPLVMRPSWHRAWGRACCRSSLAKRLVNGLFICRIF